MCLFKIMGKGGTSNGDIIINRHQHHLGLPLSPEKCQYYSKTLLYVHVFGRTELVLSGMESCHDHLERNQG